MKFICSKSELAKAVSIALRAVPSKTTSSILESILITADEQGISLQSNNMDLGIYTVCTGMVIVPGKIALEAKLFSEIIRKLPDNDIIIETTDTYQALITCEKLNYTLAAKPGDDFIPIPIPEKNNPVTLSQYTLRQIINQTLCTVIVGDSSNVLTGELFEIQNDMFRVVALDGHRVSIRRIALKEDFGKIRTIIPGKTLSEISKILNGNTEDEVTMYFSDNFAVFEFDSTIVVSRILEGEFYNVDNMISNDYMTKITISRRGLIDCIERATLLVKEVEKRPLVFSISDNQMDIRINTPLGSMNESIDISKDGKNIRIGFNPRLMGEILRVIDDDVISMYFNTAKSPCFIKDDNQAYVYVILPINF